MEPTVEIIPAILARDEEDLMEKVISVSSFVNWVQVDVTDGLFTDNKTWGDPDTIRNYIEGVFFEVHLMVREPEKVIEQWAKSGAKRIYIHYESTIQHTAVLTILKSFGIEAGIALLPDTSVDVLGMFDDLLDAALIFSGKLGNYGGEFLREPSLSKISTLRERRPDIIIEVDGGITPDSARLVCEAGANAIVSGGFIYNSDNIEESINKIRKSVNC